MAEVHRDGEAFVVLLSNDEVDQLARGVGVASYVAPEIAAVIGPVVSIIIAVNLIGLRNGVEISGAIGSAETLILPRSHGVYGNVWKTAGEIGRVFIKFNPSVLLTSLGINVLGSVLGSGKGEVHADASNIGQHETFVMVVSNEKVGFLSHRGFFHANRDDMLVYGNKEHMGDDEQWELHRHANNAVSFRCRWRTWMSADDGRKNRVASDRQAAGSWEVFGLKFLAGGKVAIQDHKGTYLRVA